MRTLSALMIVTLALAAGGCGNPGAQAKDFEPMSRDALVAAAKKEGQLTWYTTASPEDVELMTTSFEKEYGIEVKPLRLNSGAMLERFAGEQQSGVANADVFEVATPEMFGAERDWFAPLDEGVVPTWSGYPDKGKHGNYVTLVVQPAVIQYNTKLVPENKVPRSWEDMLDPFWKGKILLTDPRSSPTYLGWAGEMKELYGTDYLTGLRAQGFKPVQSGTPGAQQVAAGSAYANFPAVTVHSTALKHKHAPIDYVVMDEGQTGPPLYGSIPANAPHSSAARLFLDYRMSVEGQEKVCAQDEVSSLYPASKVRGCLPMPAKWHTVDFGLWNDKQQKRELLAALGLD